MYSSLYYSKNFRKTTGSFWNYYPDMPKSFDYKTKLVGELPDDKDELEDIKIVVLIKKSEQLHV